MKKNIQFYSLQGMFLVSLQDNNIQFHQQKNSQCIIFWNFSSFSEHLDYKTLLNGYILGKVFKNGRSKNCGRQPLKNFNYMVCLSRPYHFIFFKGWLPQILLDPFLSTLPHLSNLETLVTFTKHFDPVGNYTFKVNNRNTRTRSEVCSKVNNKDTRTTPLAPSSLFLNLNIFYTFF